MHVKELQNEPQIPIDYYNEPPNNIKEFNKATRPDYLYENSKLMKSTSHRTFEYEQ